MEKENLKQELQVEEDMRFIRRDWVFERTGWVFMALVVLAALTGLFGKSGLIWNKQTIGSPENGPAVEYLPFWRMGSPEELKITARGTDTQIVLQSRQLQMLKIENLTPQPEHADLTADRFTLSYRPASGTRTILIDCKPAKFGQFKASVIAGTKPPVNFSVFIYP